MNIYGLKPCPYCGSADVLPVQKRVRRHRHTAYSYWYVFCRKCKRKGGVASNILEVKDVWNRRADNENRG